ncbi:hypothetical protein CFIMG_008371RA00001 [Ceratocystis fimbriata CBS 114723]|uniref:DUF3074 domain-containing protein n=1 Tax=Ceratocystis fimbriata CBS 114723 TaxID=1035309 RepID=A0A2C5X457_9PEZI|nr:hypothetical protein CFIMG_008371RA00001 [Ceratocystis fimbriata CBS 114723]
MVSSVTLGPLIRLWGLRVTELPQPSSPPDELQPFVISVLEEAIHFLDSVPTSRSSAPTIAKNGRSTLCSSSQTLWKFKDSYPYSGGNTPLVTFQRAVTPKQLRGVADKHNVVQEGSRDFHTEFWVCRQSEHEDAARKGTACWDEFARCFRDENAEAEKAFTPSIVDREIGVQWNCEGIVTNIEEKTWGNITLKLKESRHRIGFPFKDRAFAVLQMTATVVGAQEFIIVSIAVNETRDSPLCRISKSPSVVNGAYSSVERIRKLPRGTIEWTVATASDARGVLPRWAQRRLVPPKIRHDVPLFLTWLATQRT